MALPLLYIYPSPTKIHPFVSFSPFIPLTACKTSHLLLKLTLVSVSPLDAYTHPMHNIEIFFKKENNSLPDPIQFIPITTPSAPQLPNQNLPSSPSSPQKPPRSIFPLSTKHRIHVDPIYATERMAHGTYLAIPFPP